MGGRAGRDPPRYLPPAAPRQAFGLLLTTASIILTLVRPLSAGAGKTGRDGTRGVKVRSGGAGVQEGAAVWNYRGPDVVAGVPPFWLGWFDFFPVGD